MQKLKVAILGASGAVGQRFIQLLDNHPWFEVHELVGKSSAGKRYGDAVHWMLDDNPPSAAQDIVVKSMTDDLESPLVFSALPKEAAVDKEPALAAAGHIVCTNASAYRMTPDVPLLLPEINADHLRLIDVQRSKRGWTSGALIANSNCTTMPLVMSLAPLRGFGISKVLVVSEQAVSGAGYPGVPSLDVIDNIIPYVSGDEGKMETEPRKILGVLDGEQITEFDATFSATATRVPVIDGHLVNISVSFRESVNTGDILRAWEQWEGDIADRHLPSAPASPLQYLAQIDRPQPRRDRNAGNGMMTSIGRLRECAVLDYKFAALTHNTIRGAAGCSILNAELLAADGYIHNWQPSEDRSLTEQAATVEHSARTVL